MKFRWTPILCYHRVSPRDKSNPDSPSLGVTPVQFEGQLRLLKTLGYRSVSIHDLIAYLKAQKNIPPKSVVFTFDDGYKDNYVHAFPLLKKYGFTATVFLVTDRIGGTNTWDSGTAPLLNEAEIEEMQMAGITFGSHTATHIDMSKTGKDEIAEELLSSRKKLESLTSRLDVPFCYPYSRINEGVKRQVREAGYLCGIAVNSGPADDQSLDFYEMMRVQVFSSTSLPGFWKKLQPWYPRWLKFQQKLRGK